MCCEEDKASLATIEYDPLIINCSLLKELPGPITHLDFRPGKHLRKSWDNSRLRRERHSLNFTAFWEGKKRLAELSSTSYLF